MDNDHNIYKLRLFYFFNQVLFYIPIGLIFPIRTLYLLDKGFSFSLIGVSIGIYSLIVIIFEIPTGGLSDKIGRIRLFRIALGLDIISKIIFLLSNTFLLLILSMVVMGISKALNSGSLDAWFIDQHRKSSDDLKISMTMSAGIIPGILSVATLLGGIIPDHFPNIKIAFFSGNKYYYNLIIAIFFQIIHFMFIIRVKITDNFFNREKSRPDSYSGILKNAFHYVTRERNLRNFLLISFFLGIALSGIEGFWQPYVRNISANQSSMILGVLSFLYFLGATLGSLFSFAVNRKIGEKALLVSMKISHGLTLVGIGLLSNIYFFSFSFTALFVFHGILEGPHQAIFNNNIPSRNRSSILSIDSFTRMIGSGIGAIFFGYIVEKSSISIIWLISGLLLIFSALLYLPIDYSINQYDK